jgi:hypothetical protein
MKNYLFVAILVAVTSEYCKARQESKIPSDSPVAVVADVIKHDDWNGCKNPGQMFGGTATDLMKKRFTDGFVKDWNRIAKAAKDHPYLDGDVLTGFQGVSDVTYDSARVKSISETKAEVEATFHFFEDEVEGRPKKTKTISFTLFKETGFWKVDDYEYEDWVGNSATESKTSTLKSVKSTFRKVHQGDP